MTSVQFLETLVSLTVQVGVVVCVAQWLSRGTSSEQTRERLWRSAFAAILLLTAAAAALPHLRLWQLPSPPSAHAAAERLAWLTSAGRLAAGVWLAGALLATIKLLAGWRRVSQWLAASRPCGLADTTDALDDVEVRTHAQAESPFCWQIHRPLIVLPASFQELPAGELRLVLRHELEHLRRGHPLQLFVQRLTGILYWYHPAVWWAAAQAEAEREFVCDAAAAQTPAEAAQLLRCLLRIAEAGPVPAGTSVAGLPFGGSAMLVVRRAEHLVARTLSPIRPPARRGLASAPYAAALLAAGLWWPLGSTGPQADLWSPWPAWSARALHTLNIAVRDYEIDGHRTLPHELAESRRPLEASPRP